MAGHSKWANIRFRKAAQDARRGKLFSRLIREITVAARSGGSDPAGNSVLRTAVEKALAANMGRDTIERAIKRGSGELDGAPYEEVRYEGYAAGGAAVLVECATDNRNRTVGEVRYAFSKHGGNLGADGSVAYLFNKVGLIALAAGSDEDAVMEVVVTAGADDVELGDDGLIEVTASPRSFHEVLGALRDAGFETVNAAVVQLPLNEAPLDADDAEKVVRLLAALEELDDVQDVYTNAGLPPGFESGDDGGAR